MSYHTRSLSQHIRQPSTSGSAATAGQPAVLVARVNDKKAELEHLKELLELSAAIATQMEALEQKLATLSDGTEAIALVMANWHNVLRAINMASAKLARPIADADAPPPDDASASLPQTLVRIPTEHAPALQAQTEGAAAEED